MSRAITWSTRGLREDPHAWWAVTVKSIQAQSGLAAGAFAKAMGMAPKAIHNWTVGKIPADIAAAENHMAALGVERSIEGTAFMNALEEAKILAAKQKATACSAQGRVQDVVCNAVTIHRAEKARERPCIRCSIRTQWRTTDGQPLCRPCVEADPLAD